MKLKFIQYTSPQNKSGGYQWVERSGIGEPLEKLNSYLRKVDWLEYEENSRCGILILPDNNVGIIFKIIKGLSAYDKREAKHTTNGAVFSLAEAQLEGIDGIWRLPFLNDPAEENRQTVIFFSPETELEECSCIRKAIIQNEESLFWIFQNSNASCKIEKLVSKTKPDTVKLPPSEPQDDIKITHRLLLSLLRSLFKQEEISISSTNNTVTMPISALLRLLLYAVAVGAILVLYLVFIINV